MWLSTCHGLTGVGYVAQQGADERGEYVRRDAVGREHFIV